MIGRQARWIAVLAALCWVVLPTVARPAAGSIATWEGAMGRAPSSPVCAYDASAAATTPASTWRTVTLAARHAPTGVPRPSTSLFALGRAAEDAAALSRGWRVGDPVDALTRAGKEPAWSTVRARYWKNAADAAEPGEYSAANLARMRRGLAPQENGVSMELHHINPRRLGGSNAFENLEPLWPDEHAAVDPSRHVGGGG